MPVSDPFAEDDIALLSRAARAAGEIALRYFRQAPKVWMKAGDSPVSEADLAVDAFLKDALLTARPNYGWISEETGDDRAGRSYRRFFVVDPIDGTRGFIEHKDEWCISIAVVEKGRPLAGVLECPARGEHFVAQAGKPALLNGSPVVVAAPGLRRPPLVSCQASIINRLPASFARSVTLESYIPSLAYRLALVSCGRLDAVFIRPRCHDWDIAAADIILQQSGGMLADAAGRAVIYQQPPFCHDFLFAGVKGNFEDMLDIVRHAQLR